MTGLMQIQWTSPNIEEDQSVASDLLQPQLLASVNLIPNVKLLFTWEGFLQITDGNPTYPSWVKSATKDPI